MALSITNTLKQVRVLVAQVTGMKRVYSPSETDTNRVPLAFNELPCALVIPGATLQYILMNAAQRHTYEVKIQIFESGPDIGTRANNVLPFVDLIISKFENNVALGARVNSCIFAGQSGLVGLQYGGIEYSGYDLTLHVSEEVSAAPVIGA